MQVATHLDLSALEAGLADIARAPRDRGELAMIVRRPAVDAREVLVEGRLDLVEGLVGDSWRSRGSSRMADGSAHPDMQLNVMNSRVIALVAGARERWPLAGDQLFVDLDLGVANLPAGTQLAVGTAVIAVTDQIHAGCQKFAARFGRDALAFVNAPRYRHLRLRGLNARVVQPGVIRPGDILRKL